MTTITINNGRGNVHTLTWGSNYKYRRVDGSITLVVGCVGGTLDGPCGSALGRGSIGVEFDVCPDGSIQVRGVGIGDGNSYMHILTSDGPPTPEQVSTLEARPFGAGAGRDVIAWADGEAEAKIAERYHD